MVIVTLILALALAVLAAILALQNPGIVELKFFSMVWEDSLAVVLIITYGVGILTGILLLLPGTIANRAKLALARRKLDSISKTSDKESIP
jgi:uncharacterized integral membrane protein